MVKAQNLIKEQKERENRKIISFNKIFEILENKIISSSNSNLYYTWYCIPEFILGLPIYSIKDCKEYIEKKLKANGFEIEFYEPNILLIKWFPK
jgi:hypothetical protein